MHSSLIEKDLLYIWHPFTSLKPDPGHILIVNGRGSLLIDEKGKAYIDAISSWWVNLHGHAHPYIAESLYKQAKKLEHVIFAGFTHLPAIQLAERLLKILPGNLSKVFFSDNGSTSTEVALKMALQYWWNQNKHSSIGGQNRDQKSKLKKKKILALNNSYHGDTFGAMSVSERGVFTLAFHDLLFEVLFIDPPSPANLDQLTTMVQKHAGEIAAFIYEPLVQGAGGMKMYDAGSLNALLRTCKQHEIICIADEVMTGFGRTGKLFASEFCEENPDIICLSKGLTGGTMAMGLTVCSSQIVEAFQTEDKLKTFFHGHSYTANPLSCAAALACLDLLMEPECKHRIEGIIQQHRSFASRLQANLTQRVKNIRQQGTIMAFEVVSEDKDEYLNEIGPLVTKKCLEKGVYIRPLGNTVYLMPPYCITMEELDKLYEVVMSVMEEL